MSYHKIKPEELSVNPFTLFDRDWALLSAGNEQRHNSMIVSWGGVGTLWGKSVVTAYVRPQRYTMEFMEKEDLFTLSFYTEEQHGLIAPFGSKSGRDCDKYALTGVSPVFAEGTVFTDRAHLVLICRKMSAQNMDPTCFLDGDIDSRWYPRQDYHRVFVGEVLSCLVQDA